MDKPHKGQRTAERYARAGHPSIEELVAEQGTRFPADPAELLAISGRKKSPLRTSCGRFASGADTATVIAQHDVVSFLFKNDSRAQLYPPLLRNRTLLVSFMTEAELESYDSRSS